jgi:hypothetical protein
MVADEDESPRTSVNVPHGTGRDVREVTGPGGPTYRAAIGAGHSTSSEATESPLRPWIGIPASEYQPGALRALEGTF